MKPVYPAAKVRYYTSILVILAFLAFTANNTDAQSCPLNSNTSLNNYPNTYYPAQASVSAGSTSITLAAAGYGSTPISIGDILLVIQMQGAQLNSNNTSSYGDGTGTGSGYLNNSALLAGNMEYVVAASNVSLSGGTLTLSSGLSHSYQISAFGTDGQYTYQVIRVPVYYDVTLTANITAPKWNGASGGVIVLYATDNINMAGYTIDASGLGFRGGGGRALSGGSGSSTDFITLSSNNANGSKGEGIAGTPKYINDSYSSLITNTSEGYPSGSYARGAPGNAGGGGTDANPSSNDQNSGGGGGSSGGAGGNGGNSWSSNLATGGKPGAVFSQASPSRLTMGGGGGAGTTNDATGSPSNGLASSGAAGGGIIIVVSYNTITGSGTIKVNGTAGNATVKNDGAGGGGAAGAVIIYSKNSSLSSIYVSAKGGNGGSNQVSAGSSGAAHGPGGGGGGGVIYSNSTLNASSTVAGGNAGTTSGTTTNYGATAGSAGVLNQSILPGQMTSFPLTCVILSASFMNVSAVRDNGITTLSWQVSNETNVQEYLVERSVDGVNYTVITHVSSNARTSAVNTYEYQDNDNITGTGSVYYRIKEMATSGNTLYSKIVSVQMDGLAIQLKAFPNPAKTFATVCFVATADGDVSLRLFDMKGSTIWQKQVRVSAGANSIILDQLANIPNGIYILQCFDGLKPQQVRLVVNH
jgi:hypothetical protein